MKAVALISGGKDSCFAMMKAIEYGHEVVALANLLPADDAVDELDSYMYQTVGHQIVVSYAKCMGLPLFRRRLQGTSRHQDLSYKMTPGDEVEDLFILLSEIKKKIPSVTAVTSGAIASDYQRLRVESVCSRLGLVSLAYLWRQDQKLLLEEMVKSGIRAILVKVAAIGLDPAKHLNKDIATMEPLFHHLNKYVVNSGDSLYGSNICGEGGEYETLTLDCPLFKFARIVLDDYQVVLHSPDRIAPVGVLHPLAFHLEDKGLETSSGDGFCTGEMDNVHEVQGNCQHIQAVDSSLSSDLTSDMTKNVSNRVLLSRKDNFDTFSLSGWLLNSPQTSTGLQDDMKAILWRIESYLRENGFGWQNVLYIHLYIADMDKFAAANETYVSFITQERCPYGVPSRSTIELPLLEVGLGEVYIEVLVARDLAKKVLHVQSISCWAPSCIGPYSQATLYKGLLHMAGQLGLDPATMTLCKGGPSYETEQALLNSEAAARSFSCSISTSTILFIVYCSTDIDQPERAKVQEKLKSFLQQLKMSYSNKQNHSIDPIILYVQVSALPKRASVEIKPLLRVTDGTETDSESITQDGHHVTNQSYWGIQDEIWHGSCLDKCIIEDEVLAAVLCITEEIFLKARQGFPQTDQTDNRCQNPLTENLLAKVVKLCIYLLDKELVLNSFSWQDTMHLRIYFQARLPSAMEKLSSAFTNAFHEFAEMNHTFKNDHNKPIFNLIPVLHCGRSATSMDSLITCELLAQKNHQAQCL